MERVWELRGRTVPLGREGMECDSMTVVAVCLNLEAW